MAVIKYCSYSLYLSYLFDTTQNNYLIGNIIYVIQNKRQYKIHVYL